MTFLCTPGGHRVEADDTLLKCSMTGKTTTLGELRKGEFVLVDPVAGHFSVCVSLLSLSLSVSPSPSYPSQLALSLLWDSDALIEYASVCRSKIACTQAQVQT